MWALAILGAFALLYQLYGGLKAVALTDIVQASLLVLGGLLVAGLTLSKIGDGAGIVAGFGKLWAAHPEHFHMILGKDSRSEEHTSELQSLMRISYAVFCLKK